MQTKLRSFTRDRRTLLRILKGQGWVPSSVPTTVFEAKGYRVTVEARYPKVGERYFYESNGTSMEMTVQNLVTKDKHKFPCGTVYGGRGFTDSDSTKYRVCTFEEL